MRSKKKVLHFIRSLGNGGWENALLRVLPLLTNELEHRVITLSEPGELASHFIKKGIFVIAVRQKNILDVSSYSRLLSEIWRFEPDSVITYLFHADMIGRFFLQPILSLQAKWKKPIPVIPFLGTTYNYSRYRFVRILERVSKYFVHHYLANSPAVKDFYVKNIGVSEDRISVMLTGIDTDYFDHITPNPELRKSLGIAPDDFIISCIANLHPNKGHRYLLDAFEQLHRSSSSIISIHQLADEKSLDVGRHTLKLLLVGEGTERENLEWQIRNYRSKNDILFLGHRVDVPDILKTSNCFVLPTFFEGMSNAIMEAMASGLPIVTTDIPENRELVTHEKTALLCPIGDVNCILQSIERILNNPVLAHTLAQNARLEIKQKYNIVDTAKRWNNFFLLISKK